MVGGLAPQAPLGLAPVGHTRVTVAKYPTFGKIQHRGGRHLGFVFLQHIAVTIGDVCLKFGKQIDICLLYTSDAADE